MENLVKRLATVLVENEHARANNIIGCTEEEILLLEKDFSVKLPAAYKVFLRTMGKEAGLFESDTTWSINGLRTARHLAQKIIELMQEDDDEAISTSVKSFNLKKTDFVFESGDYFFFYFDTTAGDDPPVIAVKDSNPFPDRTFPSYSNWLEVIIEEYSLREGMIEEVEKRRLSTS